MRSLLAISAIFTLAMAGAVHAGGDGTCQCRANGGNYDLNTVVCIRNGSLSFLARCEMVLNNTAWKKLADSCPYSSNDTKPGTVVVALATNVTDMCEPARWLGKRQTGKSLSRTRVTAHLPAGESFVE